MFYVLRISMVCLSVVHVLSPLSQAIQGMGDVLWNYFILESDGPTHPCRAGLSNTSGTDRGGLSICI